MIKVIVGLGNPGQQYLIHRHNIGFLFLDFLISAENLGVFKMKFSGGYLEGQIEGQKFYFLKPQTYMNLSGRSVAELCTFYKIKPEEVLVIHDELDLPFGEVRLKQGGGAGGHNGLKSIDGALGKDYYRLRLGIGRPDDKADVSNYVLSNFSKAQIDHLSDLFDDIVRFLPDFLKAPSNETKATFLEKVKKG